MKDKDIIIPNMLSDETMLNDMRLMLDEELAKPENERDLDTIRDITAAMVELADDHVPQIPSADFILGKAEERKRSGIRVFRRWAAAISACFAVCIGLNGYTLATYGENLLETVLRKTKSGFALTLSNDPDDKNAPPLSTATAEFTTTEWTVPWKTTTGAASDTTVTTETEAVTTEKPSDGNTTPDDMIKYISGTIRDFCGEHDVAPYVPTKLPEEMAYNGFFEAVDTHYEDMTESDDFYFTFTNGNEQQFSLTIEKYSTHKDLPEILIPSDDQKFIEGTQNGIHAYVFPTRNRVTVIFTCDNIAYTINGYNISADALMQLAYSFVPSDNDIK